MMIKFRLYYDKDLEQDWLNKMSTEGWALVGFFLGFYRFIRCEPGEYIYQIDLLNGWSGDKKDFSTFMEDSGVEVVDQWYRWVYLRKKTSEGPFEMYTDIESKIAQYSRIKRFFKVGLVLEIICFCMEVVSSIETGRMVFWMFSLLLGLIVLAFLRIVWKCKWKIEQLEGER